MSVINKDESSVHTESKLSKDYVAYLTQLRSSWSSYGASKLLTTDLINYLIPRFYRCTTTLKVRILLSLLYLPPKLLEECREPLSHLLSDCETESDDWVRKLSRLLQPYVATGHIDIREIDTEVAYRCMKYLDGEKKKSGKSYRLKPPLEYSRIFDVTEDAWPPAETCQASLAGSPYPVNIAKYLASLPPYQTEVNHFAVGGDFSLFIREVEVQGLAAITREFDNLNRVKDRCEVHTIQCWFGRNRGHFSTVKRDGFC